MSILLHQLVNLLGAMLLMLAFAMISQRRVLSLIQLFTMQGATLVLSTVVVGYVTNQHHLYLSAGLTFVLKVLLIPYLLRRVIDRLHIRWDIETLINIRVAKANLIIEEVASFESPRLSGASNLRTFRDGFRVLATIMRERLTRTRIDLAHVNVTRSAMVDIPGRLDRTPQSEAV